MSFLTPATIPDEQVIRVLRIPNSLEWLALVGGALSPLFFSSQWEEYGAVSVEDASNIAKTVIQESFYGGSGLIGSIMPYATSTIPPLLLPCDGSAYSGADYPLLYARLPAALKFGAGMFLTPNLNGRVVVGAGAATGLTTRAPMAIGGAERHQLLPGEMPSHNHGLAAVMSPRDSEPGIVTSMYITAAMGSSSTGNKGSDQFHNNMQPYYALNYGIVFA